MIRPNEDARWQAGVGGGEQRMERESTQSSNPEAKRKREASCAARAACAAWLAGEPCHCATALHLPCPTCQRWAAIFTRLTLRRVSRRGTR